MNKSNLVKKTTIYTAIFLVVIFLIGMVFFRKDDSDVKENDLELNNQQLIENKTNKEIMEEQKAKTFAENFTEIHNTYMINDFSNIESLKDSMTQKLWEKSQLHHKKRR